MQQSKYVGGLATVNHGFFESVAGEESKRRWRWRMNFEHDVFTVMFGGSKKVEVDEAFQRMLLEKVNAFFDSRHRLWHLGSMVVVLGSVVDGGVVDGYVVEERG